MSVCSIKIDLLTCQKHGKIQNIIVIVPILKFMSILCTNISIQRERGERKERGVHMNFNIEKRTDAIIFSIHRGNTSTAT